jgi:hypothetical protein
MKTKVFLIALVLVFCVTTVKSQYREHRLNFIVNVEPHVNWFHPDEDHLVNGPIRLGFTGGLRFDYRFQKFYALSFGANWNQTGGNIIYKNPIYLDRTSGLDSVAANTKVTYRLQYVEIPVALKFFIPEIGYTTVFFEVGLDPMFNTQAYINATDNNIQKESFQQGINQFNLAWHSGLGFRYSLGGNISLQFALMYKNTFLDVTNESNIRKADNSRINQVGLNLGIVF